MGLVVRTLITALGLWLASALVPGIHINDTLTLLLAAFLLGVVNALIRPIVLLLTLPLTLLTLGLFIFVINAAMLGLVAALLAGFSISGFLAALFGSLIVSLTSVVSSWYIGPSGRYEVLVVKRRR